jgi:hypothetical protein
MSSAERYRDICAIVKRRRYSELSHIEEIRVEVQHGSLSRVEAGPGVPAIVGVRIGTAY